MKRPRSQAPTRQKVADETCDTAYLLGSYKRLLLGRSADATLRSGAASGGVITEVLCKLLESGGADAVLSVGFSADDPVNPGYLVSRTPEELRKRAGSVYTYISPSELKHAVAAVARERVVIVCQPCLVPLVRRWQKSSELDVVGVISFFCGYNMTHDATLYLLRMAEVTPERVAGIRYRAGEYPGGFCVTDVDGRETCFGKGSYELANLRFVRPGCARCSLYMGEEADLACGDAWLNGRRDFTAIVARTTVGIDLLKQAGKRLKLYALPEDILLNMHLPNLIYKKHGNGLVLRLASWAFKIFPFLSDSRRAFDFWSAISEKRRARKVGVELAELTAVVTLHD